MLRESLTGKWPLYGPNISLRSPVRATNRTCRLQIIWKLHIPFKNRTSGNPKFNVTSEENKRSQLSQLPLAIAAFCSTSPHTTGIWVINSVHLKWGQPIADREGDDSSYKHLILQNTGNSSDQPQGWNPPQLFRRGEACTKKLPCRVHQALPGFNFSKQRSKIPD